MEHEAARGDLWTALDRALTEAKRSFGPLEMARARRERGTVAKRMKQDAERTRQDRELVRELDRIGEALDRLQERVAALEEELREPHRSGAAELPLREGRTRDGGASDPLGRERTTSERARASRTGAPSDTVER